MMLKFTQLLRPIDYMYFTSSTGPDGEPRITHGNTLVSDLSLEEVAKTIDVSLQTYIDL